MDREIVYEQKNLIKQRVGLLEVSKRYGFGLTKTQGTDICPYCRKENFKITDDRQFKCYKCNKSGDIYTLLLDKGIGRTISEIIEILSKDSDVLSLAKSYHRRCEILKSIYRMYLEVEKSTEAKEYLASRGWTRPEIVNAIGYAPTKDFLKGKFDKEELELAGLYPKGGFKDYYDNHVIFPIFSSSGNLVHLQGRALDDRELRWKSTGGRPSINEYFFNGHYLYKKVSNYLVVCEGISDCISFNQLRIPAIAQFGVENKLSNHADFFKEFDYILFCYDRDVFPIGHKRAKEYKSWDSMLPRIIDLVKKTGVKTYYLMTPNIVGIIDFNDWLVYIDYDQDELSDYTKAHSKPVLDLAIEYYRPSISKHHYIWELAGAEQTIEKPIRDKLNELLSNNMEYYGSTLDYIRNLFHQ